MKTATLKWMFLIIPTLCVPGPAPADGQQIRLEVSPVYQVLKAGDKQTTWIRVGMEGFRMESGKKRPGVNLAIVLDKSGSMQGEKIQQARAAAIDALGLLSADDIVSIVTYDSTVNVLVPATKLTDKESVIAAINGIKASGNTALFAGVSKGAAEVRKFLEKERVNRIILLSDGLANVGPSAPGELGSLGESLLKENISVSTLGLGLGYNEDLMVQLAGKSGGNHLFIEQASELVDVFRQEFDDVLSVVAQEIDVVLTIPEGLRPIRVLGNDADITGQKIVTRIAQIYSGQDKHIVVELELPPMAAATSQELGTVSVKYTNMKTQESDHLSATCKVSFSDDSEEVASSINRKVMADVAALVSSENNKLATALLDKGYLDQCRETLQKNVQFLNTNALLCPADEIRLKALAAQNDYQLLQLEDVTSNKDEKAVFFRKLGRSLQSEVDLQQRAKSPSASKSATP